MKVIIMYRNSFIGGDGWEYYPMTVEISDNCPVCGGKRGEIKHLRFCEDGEWFSVNTWENPCGHLDIYKDCYFESLKLKEAKANQLIEYKFPPQSSRKLTKRSRRYFQHRKDNNFYKRIFNGNRFFATKLDECGKWAEPETVNAKNSIGETVKFTITEDHHFKHP